MPDALKPLAMSNIQESMTFKDNYETQEQTTQNQTQPHKANILVVPIKSEKKLQDFIEIQSDNSEEFNDDFQLAESILEELEQPPDES